MAPTVKPNSQGARSGTRGLRRRPARAEQRTGQRARAPSVKRMACAGAGQVSRSKFALAGIATSSQSPVSAPERSPHRRTSHRLQEGIGFAGSWNSAPLKHAPGTRQQALRSRPSPRNRHRRRGGATACKRVGSAGPQRVGRQGAARANDPEHRRGASARPTPNRAPIQPPARAEGPTRRSWLVDGDARARQQAGSAICAATRAYCPPRSTSAVECHEITAGSSATRARGRPFAAIPARSADTRVPGPSRRKAAGGRPRPRGTNNHPQNGAKASGRAELPRTNSGRGPHGRAAEKGASAKARRCSTGSRPLRASPPHGADRCSSRSAGAGARPPQATRHDQQQKARR